MPVQYDDLLDRACDRDSIIHQLIKVEAQVTVTPQVKHGVPKVYCIDSEIKPVCDSDCDSGTDCGDGNYCDYDCDYDCDGRWKSSMTGNKCAFKLTQIICIEIPVMFDAEVDIKKGIVCCGEPDIEPCDHLFTGKNIKS